MAGGKAYTGLTCLSECRRYITFTSCKLFFWDRAARGWPHYLIGLACGMFFFFLLFYGLPLRRILFPLCNRFSPLLGQQVLFLFSEQFGMQLVGSLQNLLLAFGFLFQRLLLRFAPPWAGDPPVSQSRLGCWVAVTRQHHYPACCKLGLRDLPPTDPHFKLPPPRGPPRTGTFTHAFQESQ